MLPSLCESDPLLSDCWCWVELAVTWLSDSQPNTSSALSNLHLGSAGVDRTNDVIIQDENVGERQTHAAMEALVQADAHALVTHIVQTCGPREALIPLCFFVGTNSPVGSGIDTGSHEDFDAKFLPIHRWPTIVRCTWSSVVPTYPCF